MTYLRLRLRRAGGDAGVTLIEVLVAMLIFALVSIGMIYTLLQVVSLTRDSRSRQVAANLAAQDIDRTREEKDIFEVLDKSYDTVLNGDTFHIARDAEWVSDPGLEFACGAGGGGGGGAGTALRYKRVNIRVTWDGMRTSSKAVQADTVLDAKNRINDPTRGTLLVSVLNDEGMGSGLVTVTAQTVNAAGALTGTPLPSVQTDADGCAYVLKVVPGDYRITISRAGFVDIKQNPSPYSRIGVVANGTAAANFSYAAAVTYTLRYGLNISGVTPAVPNASMATTFTSTYGPRTPTAASGTSTPRTYKVFPVAAGYQIFAGTCTPVVLGPEDPQSWVGGVRAPATAAPPGGSIFLDVPMGIVKLQLAAGAKWVKAVPAAAPADADSVGCPTGPPLDFGPSAVTNASGAATIALPYGYWKLYSGTSSGTQNTPVIDSQVTLVTGGSIASGTVIVLDPRDPEATP